MRLSSPRRAAFAKVASYLHLAALASLASLAALTACGFDGVGTGLTESSSATEPPPRAGAPSDTAPTTPAPADAAPPPTVPVTPCSDGVLAFDGVDDVASAPHAGALDLSGDFTVEAWIKPGPKAATAAEMHIVSHHDYAASRGWVLMLVQGRVELIVYGSESFSAQGYSAGNGVAGGYVTPGKWAHVAGTLRGDMLRVYYDGVLRDTQQIGFFFGRDHYSGPVTLGRAAWTQDYRYEGELDDVRLSNIARYAGSTAPKPTAPLPVDSATVASWRFDEPTGIALLDGTASRHDATLGAASAAPARVAGACVAAR